MALGGGMQDKNEVGAGRSYPCVPPLHIIEYDDLFSTEAELVLR